METSNFKLTHELSIMYQKKVCKKAKLSFIDWSQTFLLRITCIEQFSYATAGKKWRKILLGVLLRKISQIEFFHLFFFVLNPTLVSQRSIREDCGQEELSRCAKPLQLLQSTTDLSFAPKREELDKLCPEFHSGLRCIGSYTRRCMTQLQREQFNKIYLGTNELIKDLCREGDYQNEFLKHSPCLQTVKPRHIKCADRYQQTMSSIFKASANQTADNQQQQHSVSGENDVENVKIVCW